MKNQKQINFQDSIQKLYEFNGSGQRVMTITLQVTEDCTCACTYCYQINKSKNMMNIDTAKKIADMLFKMYDENDINKPINKNIVGLIIEFIGGEALLNIETVDAFCEYFLNRCIQQRHPWLLKTKFCLLSNGDLFFNDNVQKWYNKYKYFCDFKVTVDGPKEMHDTCRIHKDGTGNFNNAYKTYKFIRSEGQFGTKVTISPENLDQIYSTINFFVKEQEPIIRMNAIHEHCWTYEEGTKYYQILKNVAKLLKDNPITNLSVFNNHFYCDIPEEKLDCWCGGQGLMLAFNTKGDMYPCLRFMESSMGEEKNENMIIGDLKNGFGHTELQKEKIKKLLSINRRTKSTDECFYCPVAAGCPDCAAWNLQSNGDLNIKSINICNMHKAEALGNCYYQNLIKPNSIKLYLPKEDCLNFISEEEYSLLTTYNINNEYELL